MLDRNQGDELQFDPVAPALAQLEQGLPAPLRSRAEAVDMTAQGTQSLAACQLQSPLASLQNKLPGPRGVLHKIGGHRTAVGAGWVGVLSPGEGLVEMNMGIGQSG